MLSSFEIKNFRGFSHLRIDKIANVNLIVGRNGVGKTMLLEALRLYAQAGNISTILQILEDRDENMFGPREQWTNRTVLNLQSLFTRATLPQMTESGLEKEISLGQIEDAEKRLAIRINGPGNISVTLGKGQPELLELDPAKLNGRFPGNPYPLQLPPYLPARGMHNDQLAALWDLVSLRKAEERVKECLKVISEIDGISFVGAQHERIPMVRVSKTSERVPLRSLGDGIVRMLQIALTLECANMFNEEQERWRSNRIPRESLLLVDEIENGIHYSVQNDLWKFVIKTAELRGVQVFATSHSWDSILGLREAVREIPNASVMVVRLEKKPQHTKAVLFDGSELDIVAREGIEVR